MINANELRIGNYVYNRHNEIDEVDWNTFVKFRNPTMDGNPAKIFPIKPLINEGIMPLTIKNLLK